MANKVQDRSNKAKPTFLNRSAVMMIGIMAVIMLICATLSALCPIINPAQFVWIAFFGLSFWFILFANMLILILLLLLKAKKMLIVPIIAIILSVPGFLKSFSFGKSDDSYAKVKLMTFNACNLSDVKDVSKKQNDVLKSFYDFINYHNPDVLCLQEGGSLSGNQIKNFIAKSNFNHYSVNRKNVIFSKYPLEDVHSFNNDKFKGFADLQKVIIDKDTFFYLINCHFNSFQITKDEIEYINDAKKIIKDSEVYGKSVVTKLFKGFKNRSESTKMLIKSLPDKESPLIICGDFNDTPLSYTYNEMKKYGLNDAFLTNSFGIGKTYSGALPLLRIDYIWYNDLIQAVDYKRIKQTNSDHYPVMMSFNILKNEF